MSLLKLQYNFILTKKVKIISAILISLTWIILILQSGLFEDTSYLIYNREVLISAFIYDGFNIIKIVAVLYSMLLAIYVIYLNKYDVFIVTRKSRIKVILSKVAVILFLELMFVLYLFVVYGIIWGLLDVNVTMSEIGVYLFHIIELTTYYALLNIALTLVFYSIFIAVIPFIGYLISNFSIDYGISIHELSNTSKFLNLFFPDLLIFDKEICFIYGILIVFNSCILILLIIIIKYKADDIVI